MKTSSIKLRNKNKELIKFRIDRDLTQQQLADMLGAVKGTISAVEVGRQKGTITFWTKFQKVFKLSNQDLTKLMLGGLENDTEEEGQN